MDLDELQELLGKMTDELVVMLSAHRERHGISEELMLFLLLVTTAHAPKISPKIKMLVDKAVDAQFAKIRKELLA